MTAVPAARLCLCLLAAPTSVASNSISSSVNHPDSVQQQLQQQQHDSQELLGWREMVVAVDRHTVGIVERGVASVEGGHNRAALHIELHDLCVAKVGDEQVAAGAVERYIAKSGAEHIRPVVHLNDAEATQTEPQQSIPTELHNEHVAARVHSQANGCRHRRC